jgi:hypothetical protein
MDAVPIFIRCFVSYYHRQSSQVLFASAQALNCVTAYQMGIGGAWEIEPAVMHWETWDPLHVVKRWGIS